LLGSKIAGYTIESEVGEGGTSAVYQAAHQTHGIVALKVLREKLRLDEQLLRASYEKPSTAPALYTLMSSAQ
jgi:serine/threonine protein kinase